MQHEEPPESSPDEPSKSDFTDWGLPWLGSRSLLDHLGLFASTILFAVVVVRVIMVSGFSSTTAMGIVQEVGAGQVVLGTVLASGWLLAAAGCLLLGLYFLRGFHWQAWWEAGLLNIAVPVVIFCVWLLPWIAILGLVSLVIFTGIIRRLRGRQPPSNIFVATTGLIIIVGVLFGNATPWVPASRIDPRDSPAYVGYVFKEGDGELLVLRESTRELERVQESDLTSRDWCDDRPTWLRTVPELFAPSSYNRCPD